MHSLEDGVKILTELKRIILFGAYKIKKICAAIEQQFRGKHTHIECEYHEDTQ